MYLALLLGAMGTSVAFNVSPNEDSMSSISYLRLASFPMLPLLVEFTSDYREKGGGVRVSVPRNARWSHGIGPIRLKRLPRW